jgi:hypothetical protein
MEGRALSKIIARLLPLLLLGQILSGGATAQQRDRSPNLNSGDAVVTGFSGTIAPDPAKPLPRNKTAIDLTFIDPDGPSARVINITQPGYVWDGRLFAAPKLFDVLAKDVGQVFGVALDDAAQPNIYVAATSVFGLNIVSRGRDGSPERKKKGGPGAGWMKGQFGLDLQGGPGAIYKIDGRTGVPTLFANVTLDAVTRLECLCSKSAALPSTYIPVDLLCRKTKYEPRVSVTWPAPPSRSRRCGSS